MRTPDLVLWLLGTAAVLVAAHPAAAQLADSPWPSLRANGRNTGQSSFNGPSTPADRWIYDAEPIEWIVVGSQGIIYFAAEDTLYALGPAGVLKWNREVGDMDSSGLAVDSSGTLYVGVAHGSVGGQGEGSLRAIRPDGTVKWSFRTGAEVNSAPTIDENGTIYVGADDSLFYAVNPDGSEKWSYKTGNWVQGDPAIGPDGDLYVGSEDGNLYAFTSRGTLKWQFPAWTEHALVVGPDGTVYADEGGSALWTVNPDGSEKWSVSMGSAVQPSVDMQGSIYLPKEDGFAALFPNSGEVKWTRRNRFDGAGLAIGKNGVIYHELDSAFAREGPSYLEAVDRSGTLVWKHKIGPRIDAGPVIGTNRTIYVGTEEGLYAIGDSETLPTPPDMQVPTAYVLGHNYPNPFNPVTRIPYELRVAGQVRLEIYDLLGRRLKVIENDWKPAGRHVVRMRAGNLPSGTYLYRLSANGTVQERAMTIVK